MAEGAHGRISSPVLVGRERELALLAAAFAEMREGHTRLVIVGGEAGVGKSRLVGEAVDRAGGGVRLVRGRCLAAGTGIPYLPFAEMLRGLVRDLPEGDVARIVGSARDELVGIVPELASGRGGSGRAVAPSGGPLDRLRLFEALLRVAERVAAERPAVFAFEDIQWIDPASLELLAFLAHSMTRVPAALVLTVRSDALDEARPVLSLLADLERTASVGRIELRALDLEATRRQVEAILGELPPEGLVERIWELGDGNPLFTEELLVALRAGETPDDLVSPRIRDLVSDRLARLDGSTLAVLRVAAAAGRDLDEALLMEVTGLTQAVLDAAVRDAIDEGILVRADRGPAARIRFRHEIVRTVVASELLPGEATRIHAAYATALTRMPPERRSPSEVAQHWDAAGDAAAALPAHVEAALAAEAACAYEQASRHYERAIALWPVVGDPGRPHGRTRPRLMLAAASAAARAGDLERAVLLARSILEAGPDTESETVERARSSLRWYLWESGRTEEALSEARAAGRVLRRGPEPWRTNARAHEAGLLLVEDHVAQARAAASRTLAAARACDALEEEILAQGVLGWCLVHQGRVDEGIDGIRSALEAARLLERQGRGEVRGQESARYPVGVILAHMQLASALELAGRLDEAHALAIEGWREATAQGLARTYGSLLQGAAMRALYLVGRWDEAAAGADAAVAAGAVGAGRAGLISVLALVAVGRGDLDAAARALAHAQRPVGATATSDITRWLAAARAEEALWAGRPQDALTHAAAATAGLESSRRAGNRDQPALPDASVPRLLALAARACADIAASERAAGGAGLVSRIAAARIDAAMGRVRRRRVLARAWRGDLATTAAELARAGEDRDVRVRRWRASVEANSGGRPYEEAYARWRLAEALLGQPHGRDEAGGELAASAALAARLGARPLLERVEGLARRAGLTRPDEAGATIGAAGFGRPYGLTAREAEVLALLAGGLSNREIAERLFISPKTASVHVSAIYDKLGVETRVAAATVAGDLGLRAEAREGATGRPGGAPGRG